MRNHEKLKIIKKDLGNFSYKETLIIDNNILWIDVVGDKQTLSNAIFIRPFNKKNALPQRLTLNDFNIKSNFHGYGGKSYKCIKFQKHFYLIWIDQFSRSIWFQIFRLNEKLNVNENNYFLSVQEARQLSKSKDINFDSSFVITKQKILYGICEIRNIDYLYSLDLEKTNQNILKIKKFDNFAGDLSSNISSNLLSWIEWSTPFMPWEKNNLFFAQIDRNGVIRKIKQFANKLIKVKKNFSFFQPYWISENLLVCSEDSSGWWNLLFIDVTTIENITVKKRIKKKFFEYGSPQWVAGITFFAGSLKNLFCLVKNENNLILEQYQNLIYVEKFDLPFSAVSDFNAFNSKVALKGDGYDFISFLFEFDFGKKNSFDEHKEIIVNSINEFSKPESFWFKGFDNQPTHSFVYRPLVKRFNKPPLLIKAHSGPTACYDGSLNSEVQFWTAKGCFVAEVNYGGSSGFGREYRDRLNQKWGIVDSYDCKALVIELLKLNIIDSDRVIIFGNSAGGLTALNSLCDSDLFKAAVCKYPVIDLIDMYHNTHRFEKYYLNSLVGDYQEFYGEYKTRSPISKINKFTKPILLFHGKKDSVISYKQSLNIQERIALNNKNSELIIFENEGHGFRNKQNKEIVIRKTEEFLKKNFNI